MKYLKIKVFLIHILQRLKILPMVWYKSELKLAELKAIETMKKLKPYIPEYNIETLKFEISPKKGDSKFSSER